ncbi:tetratricopeptide repeat protein [Paenibacillus sp. FSL H7-0331]|uniref:tetratricopeptide repeat protein n=1 Tax=Paenibacillus sp. FSL H7-0331 TaxID=1920421 RepID=UPI00117EE549|nr:tetratricopeptide repeat protein [Paenibacillus sp. FSL H7-0331]
MNLYEQGDELYANGHYQEAYEKFESACSNGDENEANCLNYLVLYYEKIAEYEKAKQYYQMSLEINFELAERHLNLGNMYWYLGNQEKALKEHDLANQFCGTPRLVGKTIRKCYYPTNEKRQSDGKRPFRTTYYLASRR